jgi:hypothetical protein
LLKIGTLVGQDRSNDGADLEANTTVNASRKIDPIPSGSLRIFAGTFFDTSDGTGIDAVGDAFADIGDDGVGHGEGE